MNLSKKGFTLIELLVVISIIAMLSIIGMITYSSIQLRARDAKRKTDLRSIKVALELYKQQNGYYPSNVSGWMYSSSGDVWIPGLDFNYFSNGIPKDPLNTGTSPFNTSTGYVYAYIDNAAACSYPIGQWFILVAQLENKQDQDRIEIKNYKWCDGTNIYNTQATYTSPSAFIVTSW